jgi:hypothetical protein
METSEMRTDVPDLRTVIVREIEMIPDSGSLIMTEVRKTIKQPRG